MRTDRDPIYRVLFYQQDKLYEVYAKYLTEESLMGFIEVEELIFQDTKSGIVVDPSEEKLRAEFKSVKRSYIPLHTIIRIDEVMQEGPARIKPVSESDKPSSNVSHLPFHFPGHKHDE